MKVVLKCIVEFIGKKQAPKHRQKALKCFAQLNYVTYVCLF